MLPEEMAATDELQYLVVVLQMTMTTLRIPKTHPLALGFPLIVRCPFKGKETRPPLPADNRNEDSSHKVFLFRL